MRKMLSPRSPVLSPRFVIIDSKHRYLHGDSAGEFRRLLTNQLHDREEACLPAHLQHLSVAGIDHAKSVELAAAVNGSCQSFFLRSKFGTCFMHNRFEEGVGHACKHCSKLVNNSDGVPELDKHLHPADYVHHALFTCTAPPIEAQRDILQHKCDTFTAKMRAAHGDAVPAFFLVDAATIARYEQRWWPDELALDPRGLLLSDTNKRLQHCGMDIYDLVKLYNNLASPLGAILMHAGADPSLRPVPTPAL